jgi:hypothetical protein
MALVVSSESHTHGTKIMDDLFGSTPTPPAPEQSAKKAPKPPTLYPIPANSRREHCKGEHCGMLVYWVEGRKFPISADIDRGFHPNTDAPIPKELAALLQPGDGLGVSHFVNCPDAKTFSHRKKDG